MIIWNRPLVQWVKSYMVDGKHLKSLVCQRQQKSCKKLRQKAKMWSAEHEVATYLSCHLFIFRLRSHYIVMYILHPLTNARKVHLRAQKLGFKKSLQTTTDEENRDLSFLSYIWSTLDNKNVLFSVTLLRKRLNKTMQGLQGGITCGAIDEPRKSSKAIDECVIINFRNKNVVIARFCDKNEVFVLFSYIYIY